MQIVPLFVSAFLTLTAGSSGIGEKIEQPSPNPTALRLRHLPGDFGEWTDEILDLTENVQQTSHSAVITGRNRIS